MLHWLLRMWRRLGAWMVQRPVESAHHYTFAQPYHPSNLHARHH
jgi:hypothetical protein